MAKAPSRSPDALLADPARRRSQSRWMWIVYLGFGFLSWIGFLYIGLQARKARHPNSRHAR